MIVVREDLARLLRSSRERIRLSRIVRDRSREIIRQSRQAVSISHAVIGQSDQTIGQLQGKCSPPGTAEASKRSDAPADVLQVLSGLTLENQTIEMDGKHFIDCCVLNCTLEYSGQPLIVESTRFDRCSFRFGGEAALTLKFLECFGLASETHVDYTIAPAHVGRSLRPN